MNPPLRLRQQRERRKTPTPDPFRKRTLFDQLPDLPVMVVVVTVMMALAGVVIVTMPLPGTVVTVFLLREQYLCPDPRNSAGDAGPELQSEMPRQQRLKLSAECGKIDAEPEQTIASVGTLERLAMYWRDRRDREEILRALADVPGIAVTSSHPKNIEVMDESASKGASLAWLCGHLGIDPAEAVAFGDNFNDIEMLETAGTGIAVANAEPEVLAHADRQTAGNDEDGVARAIMELLGAEPAPAR